MSSIPLDEFPGVDSFINDYANDFSRFADWYDFNPRDPASINRHLVGLESCDGLQQAVNRDVVVDEILRQQAEWGGGDRAKEAAELIRQRNAYTVITGQQTGLFGGPLYSVLKAISAILWARKLKESHPDKEFIPLFYLGTSDSDFDEVRKTSVLDGGNQVHEFSLTRQPQEDEGKLIGERDVSGQINQLLDELGDYLKPGLFFDETITLFNDCYRDQNLVVGFARLMAKLFAGTELVIVNAQNPVFMEQLSGLIKAELESAEALEEKLIERNQLIKAAGYTPQVSHLADDTNLFLLDDNKARDKIARDCDDFYLRRSDRKVKKAELLSLLENSPERFVPGVMLLPIMKQTLLPTAMFIGGAAEIKYHAQVATGFAFHQIPMAPAVMRITATLVSKRERQIMDDYGLSMQHCYLKEAELTKLVIADKRPPQIDIALSNYGNVIAQADEQLRLVAVEMDPTLDKSFETLRNNLVRHMDKLEKKITSSLKRQNEETLERILRLQRIVFPNQVAQERLVSILGVLPASGVGIINGLIHRLDADDWAHQLVILE